MSIIQTWEPKIVRKTPTNSSSLPLRNARYRFLCVKPGLCTLKTLHFLFFLKTMIASHVGSNHNYWGKYLPELQLVLNLKLICSFRGPLEDPWSLVSKNLWSVQCHQKWNYDEYRRDIEFEEQDQVWVMAHLLSKAQSSIGKPLTDRGHIRCCSRLDLWKLSTFHA